MKYRAKWMLSAFKDWRKLRNTLESVIPFYANMLIKAPGLSVPEITITLKSGETIGVREFMTLYIFREIFVDKVYDMFELGSAPVVIDVGANVGLFSLRIKQRFPEAEIHAFEPYEPNYERLIDLVNRNHLTKIYAHQKGVFSSGGSAKLSIHPTNAGGHSIVHNVGRKGVDIELISVRDLPNRADLLKLDCEGAEYEIIKSLENPRYRLVIWEAHPGRYNVDDLVQHMITISYTVQKFGDLYLATAIR